MNGDDGGVLFRLQSAGGSTVSLVAIQGTDKAVRLYILGYEGSIAAYLDRRDAESLANALGDWAAP